MRAATRVKAERASKLTMRKQTGHENGEGCHRPGSERLLDSTKRLIDSGFTEKQAGTLAEDYVALLNVNLAVRICMF